MAKVPRWFWTVLARTKPNLNRLAEWLIVASKEQIEDFALAYELAAGQVAQYYDGPEVDGEQYSEDNTEDLCKWIVSQGEELWQKAVSKEIDLVDLAHLYQSARFGAFPEYPVWTPDIEDKTYHWYSSPESLAWGIYEMRYGADLYEVISNLGSDRLKEID